MSMPRSTSKSQSFGEVRGCRHQPGPSALAGSARANGLPTLAVAIFLCGVQTRHPARAATFGAERHISTGATLRIRLLPRVSDGKSLFGPRVEDARPRKPVVSVHVNPGPGSVSLLATSAKLTSPSVYHPVPELHQGMAIGRDGVIPE